MRLWPRGIPAKSPSRSPSDKAASTLTLVTRTWGCLHRRRMIWTCETGCMHAWMRERAGKSTDGRFDSWISCEVMVHGLMYRVRVVYRLLEPRSQLLLLLLFPSSRLFLHACVCVLFSCVHVWRRMTWSSAYAAYLFLALPLQGSRSQDLRIEQLSNTETGCPDSVSLAGNLFALTASLLTVVLASPRCLVQPTVAAHPTVMAAGPEDLHQNAERVSAGRQAG